MEKEPQKRLKALLDGYLLCRLTPVETAELAGYVADPMYADILRDFLEEAFHEEAGVALEVSRRDHVTQRILGASPVTVDRAVIRRARSIRRLLPYAAVAMVLIGLMVWLLDLGLGDKELGQELASIEISPGGNRATLILADGRSINLSGTQSGIIVGPHITYMDGSEVHHNDGVIAIEDNLQYAELQTPRGGTYQVTLPDGTRVWLNAESTLKYPLHFNEAERVVELTGEGYFEVQSTAATTQRPFKVLSKGQAVVVLGTKFNISAYEDQVEIRTTLIGGKVQITALAGERLQQPLTLQPGQQAIVTGVQSELQEVDTDQFTAWKDGFFNFNGTTLKQAMRQLERWYDIQVVYESGGLEQVTLRGDMERSLPLQTVLEILERLNLSFRMEEGRRLVILARE